MASGLLRLPGPRFSGLDLGEGGGDPRVSKQLAKNQSREVQVLCAPGPSERAPGPRAHGGGIDFLLARPLPAAGRDQIESLLNTGKLETQNVLIN